jgi:hypothetical protein
MAGFEVVLASPSPKSSLKVRIVLHPEKAKKKKSVVYFLHQIGKEKTEMAVLLMQITKFT